MIRRLRGRMVLDWGGGGEGGEVLNIESRVYKIFSRLMWECKVKNS